MLKGYLEDEKTSWIVFVACFIVYAVSSMTKNTYSTAIVAIVQEGLFSKASAGIINSCFYIFYGVAQIFCGYLVDRTSPYKIIFIGLIGAMLANAVMALSSSFIVMLVAWSFHGITQSGIWPAVLKIISTALIPEHRQKGKKYIVVAACVGPMISYIAAMAILGNLKWSALFSTSVVALILAIVFFFLAMCRMQKNTDSVHIEHTEKSEKKFKPDEQKSSVPLLKLLLVSGTLYMLLPALIRCMLDLGVKNWVPTMIAESYGTSPGFSSMLTAILLLINLTGIFMAEKLYPAYCKNAITASIIFFVASLPLLILLFFIGKLKLVFIVIFLTLITTFMNAVSQLFNVVLPIAFSDYGKTATIAGLLTAFASFGNVIANFIYGLIAENFGWDATILVWVILAVIAILFCLISIPKWKEFTTY